MRVHIYIVAGNYLIQCAPGFVKENLDNEFRAGKLCQDCRHFFDRTMEGRVVDSTVKGVDG